jgi:hypothetical protein
MSYWISGAILLTGAYTANEARKSRKDAEAQQRKALEQQAADQQEFRTTLANQTEVFNRQAGSLESQAKTARDTLAETTKQMSAQLSVAQDQLALNTKAYETGVTQYEASRMEMERKAKEIQGQIDEERRKAAEQQATQLRARTRGGRRALLSQERLTPELGITQDTLGAGMGMM